MYNCGMRDRCIHCSGKKTATNKGVSKLDFYPPQTSKWCILVFLNNYLTWIICTKWGIWKFNTSNTDISKHIVFFTCPLTQNRRLLVKFNSFSGYGAGNSKRKLLLEGPQNVETVNKKKIYSKK